MPSKPEKKYMTGAAKIKRLEDVDRAAQNTTSAERDELLDRTRQLREARLARIQTEKG